MSEPEKTELDWQEWDVLMSYLADMERGLARTAIEFGHDANDSVAITKAILAWVGAQEPKQ